MEGVTIVKHPLVQHKLTLIRDKNISTKSFRELLKEIGMLLCYEVTRDLPLTDVAIETPMARMMSPRLAGKKLVFAPILRAGVTASPKACSTSCRRLGVAHIGLYREAGNRSSQSNISLKRRRILLSASSSSSPR